MVAVEKACEAMKRREQNALILPVGGAFHSNDGTSKES
jgi:hypothetical protein